MSDGYVFDDGGRKASGFQGHAGDCVARAIAIAAELPYREVYDRLARETGAQRASRGTKRAASARNGINTKRKWFKDYMAELGFEWIATMGIGTGCKVHLEADELPSGRLVVSVSKHYTAMIDGVIHDTHDPRRAAHRIEVFPGWETAELKPGQWRNVNGVCSISRRCVYGYWVKK